MAVIGDLCENGILYFNFTGSERFCQIDDVDCYSIKRGGVGLRSILLFSFFLMGPFTYYVITFCRFLDPSPLP